MRALLLLGMVPLASVGAARAQDHAGHAMPGMPMPGDRTAARRADPALNAQGPDAHAEHGTTGKGHGAQHGGHGGEGQPRQDADPHAGHDMSTMEGHGMSAMPGPEAPRSGTDLPPGDAPAPAPSADRAADRYFGAEAMTGAERALRREHGGGTFHQLMFDIAEYRPRGGKDGYRWEAQSWIGGDISRLWLKSEGEGRFGDRVETAEIQALYSHAIDPYWNLQAGLRQDLGPGPRRTYAVLGVEGLAPYWFEIAGSLFVSDKGDVLARAEAYYDQRITQYIVLQPRIELDFALQDMPRNAIGAGLSNAELGLRLRYERMREFAPYVGISWERRIGATADFARARGEDRGGADFVLGVRAWF